MLHALFNATLIIISQLFHTETDTPASTTVTQSQVTETKLPETEQSTTATTQKTGEPLLLSHTELNHYPPHTKIQPYSQK